MASTALSALDRHNNLVRHLSLSVVLLVAQDGCTGVEAIDKARTAGGPAQCLPGLFELVTCDVWRPVLLVCVPLQKHDSCSLISSRQAFLGPYHSATLSLDRITPPGFPWTVSLRQAFLGPYHSATLFADHITPPSTDNIIPPDFQQNILFR